MTCIDTITDNRFLGPLISICSQISLISRPVHSFICSAISAAATFARAVERDQRPLRIHAPTTIFSHPSHQAFKRFLCLEHRTRGGILRTNPAFVSDPFQGTTKRSGCPGTSKMESHPPTKRHFASYACMCVFTSGCASFQNGVCSSYHPIIVSIASCCSGHALDGG